jgi:epoxyqueuosine reductase
VLDSTKCLSYLTIEIKGAIPEPARADVAHHVYGCDICQDVCPWNRGVEKRRAGSGAPADAEPHVSLVDWLTRDGDELRRAFARLYVPRNDPRYLRRNALVALGNVGGPDAREQADAFCDAADPLLREHAAWAAERLGQADDERPVKVSGTNA